jgi:uncharacterized protein YjbI with pentapeptide repeats
LSGAKVNGAAFRDTRFSDCKLMGVQFTLHNDKLFHAHFENCNLQLSAFPKMSLKKMQFQQCNLREVDFTSAELPEASFDGCDLLGATFVDSNLEKADFRNAVNVALDPDQNRIKKAKFSRDGLAGLLQKYQIEVS